MSMNPFDEIAVEEALRLKEAGTATEVVAVSIGPARRRKHIRTALAMGADRGILVETDTLVEPLAVAKILKGVVERKSLTSSSSASRRSTTIPTRPARCWPRCLAGARHVRLEGRDRRRRRADVTREVDGGLQTISVKMPAIVTTDLRLNEPRYASLPNIMKAKKKPLDEKALPTTASTLRRA
jgi:electron transfer flavoprotein beta subunit